MSKLTDEQIQAMYDECDKKSDGGNEFMLMFARAIEAAATEPLLQRIAELEHQLEEARKDSEELNFLESDLLYWVGRAVSKGNANSDTEEAYDRYVQWWRDRHVRPAMQKGQS